MFDRFSEMARRTIFYARYEAGSFGSPLIEAEHLLLGLLQEDKDLTRMLKRSAPAEIRHSIEQRTPPRESLATSVDLPLSEEFKKILRYAIEEADALGERYIHCRHLVLGTLRAQSSFAAELLRDQGLDVDTYSKYVASAAAAGPRETPEPPGESLPTAGAFQAAVERLKSLVDKGATYLDQLSPEEAEHRLRHKEWTRKEALGHLVDCAAAHQQWLARALTEKRLAVAGLPEDAWVQAQHYNDFEWQDLVDLWVCLNRLLIHAVARIPEDKANLSCKLGVQAAMPLEKLIENYVAYAEDFLAQILTRL